MNVNIRSAPARALTMELNWFDIWEIGFIKLRESTRNEAIIPSDTVFTPVSPRFFVPAIAIYEPITAMSI